MNKKKNLLNLFQGKKQVLTASEQVLGGLGQALDGLKRVFVAS